MSKATPPKQPDNPHHLVDLRTPPEPGKTILFLFCNLYSSLVFSFDPAYRPTLLPFVCLSLTRKTKTKRNSREDRHSHSASQNRLSILLRHAYRLFANKEQNREMEYETKTRKSFTHSPPSFRFLPTFAFPRYLGCLGCIVLFCPLPTLLVLSLPPSLFLTSDGACVEYAAAYSTGDLTSFGFVTARKRWPIIIVSPPSLPPSS